MSGVCGWIRFDGGRVEPSELAPMAEAAAHRGPDGRGVWCSEGVGLAHLALWVTPESVRERQPLVSEADELALVADARIDNRDELLTALALGTEATDAELILAAYRRWGVECAARLIGDFAFAIWDGRERRLFAARDPLGMRAFYYRVEPGRVLFATELKQLLAVPGVPARLFEPAVGAYLAGVFGPPEWTFYEGIAQLAPAHALAAGAAGHRTWRTWDIDPGHRIRYRREEEYTEHFRALFQEAVGARLRSIRPVGVLLSGGLDSGSIAATAGWLMQRGRAAPPALRAYSFAWDELPECDERHISGIIARHYGIEVTDVPADTAWPLAQYPAHGPDRDEPFIGVFQALFERTYDLARADGTGLLISGDRGDELVGDWVYDFPGLLRSGRLGAFGREVVALGKERGWKVILARSLRRKPWVNRTIGPAAPSPRLPGWVRHDFAERIDLPEIVRRSTPLPPMRNPAKQERYARIFRFGGARWATWQERNQARASLAWADPWADRRLAQFVLAIPQHVVNGIAERKRLARRAMVGIMPPAALKAVRKSDFAGLYDRGFKELGRDTLRDLAGRSQSEARGYVTGSILLAEYEAFLRGNENLQGDLWFPLTLEMWLRAHWPGQDM